MRSSRIRVIIADDHPIIADGIRLRLETSLMIEIVGTARSFAATLECLRTTLVDVLILDITGMQGSAIATVSRVQRDHPTVAVVIFSSILSLARDLLGAGALGYVVKEDLAKHLEQAIHTVHNRKTYLSPLVQEYLEGRGQITELSQLTPRELSILELLDKELGTNEIAEQIGITGHAVHNCFSKMHDKVGVDNRHQLLEWFRRLKKQQDEGTPSESM